MIPQQQQQVTIDQLPDERLAVEGWNQYQALDSHRRQAQLCEQNILAIRQELEKRTLARQEALGEQEAAKKSEQDLLVERLVAKLAERNGHAALAPAKEDEKKAE